MRVLEALGKMIQPVVLLQTATFTEFVVVLQLLARQAIFDSICYWHRNTWLAQVYRLSNRIL